MFPLSDHLPRRTTPIVNYILIAANILVFFWELSLGPQIERALFAVAFIPARFWYSPDLPNIITIFVSMFLIFLFIPVREIPAVVVLGLWFVLQLFTGAASLGIPEHNAGGVAYFAHIGGFIAGMVLVVLMGGLRRRPEPVTYDDFLR